jgi:hypothetical protein
MDIISSSERCETFLHMETLIHKFCHQFSSLVVSEAQEQFNGFKAFFLLGHTPWPPFEVAIKCLVCSACTSSLQIKYCVLGFKPHL